MTPRQLQREQFEVDADIRRAEGLPVEAFTDPEFQRLELDTIFARSWLLVPEPPASDATDDARPLADLLAPRGARVPVSVLDRPLFLQRGWDDDALRCFPNTCTHAWFPLVSGVSRGPSLTCAQHGRKFDCTGRVVSQPGFTVGECGFPRDADHLTPIFVAQWLSFVFVSLHAPAAALGATLDPVAESVAALPLDRLRRASSGAEVREVDGNWKQHAWNYIDRFHVQFIHRAPGGLADAVDLGSYTTELHGCAALQWAYARDPTHGFAPEQLPARFRDAARPDRRVFALWWFVFPNLSFNVYPWGVSINVYGPVQDKPDRTRFLWQHHVLDDELHARRDRTWLNEQVDREDVDAMAQVRRAMRSGHVPRPRFSPTEETGPHWFHRLVYEQVFGKGP